jgi:hypothetical protein
MATRQESPASGCAASQKQLLGQKSNPLDISDNCPICRDDYNVLCFVAKHPKDPLPAVDLLQPLNRDITSKKKIHY